MNVALLFAGQGSQQIKMGQDLYDKYDKVKEIYDKFPKIRDMIFNSTQEELKETINTQPALVLFEIAVCELLREKGINIKAVSGLSIGEFSALYASGVLSLNDAVNISLYRGELMQNATKSISTKMYALIGGELEKIKEVILEYEKLGIIEISNLNAPGQVVVAGNETVLNKAKEEFKNIGVRRIIELNVSGPFHTSYMNEVREKLMDYYSDIEFSNPSIKIALNTTGKYYKDENLKEEMANQVKQTVMFEKCLNEILNDDIDYILEIGYFNVISGFIKKIDKSRKVYPINSVQTLLEFEELL